MWNLSFKKSVLPAMEHLETELELAEEERPID